MYSTGGVKSSKLSVILLVVAGEVAARTHWGESDKSTISDGVIGLFLALLLIGMILGWQFRIAAVLMYYIIGILYGTLGSHGVEGWTFMDSFYWVTVTVTTVGYGDNVPMKGGGKIFVCFYILIGLALVADAIGAFVDYLIEQQDKIFKALLAKSQKESKETVDASVETLVAMATELKETVEKRGGPKYVQEIFARYDADDSNYLDQEELFNALGAMEVSIRKPEFDALWPIIDDDGSGEVSIDEFMEICLAADPGKKATQAHAKAQADKAVREMKEGHVKTVGWALLQFLVLVLLGATVLHFDEKHNFSFVDGIYWSVVTITTVGYGDLNIDKKTDRGFAAFYILISVFLMARNLGLVSQILMDRRAARNREELLDRPLSSEAIDRMDRDGDGEVDSGEFLMAMLVAEDICSEDVCKAYLEKFKSLDVSGDGKLSREDVDQQLAEGGYVGPGPEEPRRSWLELAGVVRTTPAASGAAVELVEGEQNA